MLLALAAATALLALVLSQVSVRTDMVDFLPRGETRGAQLVLDEARTGAATGLILMGIEGAPAPDLARISRGMADALRQSRLFALVADGQAVAADVPAAQQQALFAYRYLLSPKTTDSAFTADALRADLDALLRQLRSSAAPLAAQFGLPDPPGAFLAVLQGWIGSSQVRSIDGAWFAPALDGRQERALLLVRTRAGGMDVPAQEAATAAIDAAFHAAGPGNARLLVAGPAVFARDAARAIRGDVRRIALISTGLVVALLWWRFRSPLVIAAIAVPVVLSVAVAALAVQLGFGSVHGVALGFGTTMLGVSVDYPVLMIGHRKSGEVAAATRRRIGPAFVLAVLTAVLGLAAMVFSGFPGLAQLGVFSAVGLLAAALATWFLLPPLIVAANLAPVSAGSPAWLARVERLRRWRVLGLLPVLAALGWLGARGGPDWEGDLASLSPVPAASRALDADLRQALGAPDVGQLLIVRGADAQAVLQRQEAMLPLLDRLQRDGTITGMEAAARLVPSVALQQARQALLPDAATLLARLEQARAGLPFRPAALQPFVDAVQASRTLAPLRPESLAGTPIGVRLEPLLYRRNDAWQGPIALQGVRDPAQLAAQLAAALPPADDAVYVDMRAELGGILSRYTTLAWHWLGWSGLAVALVLLAGLRDLPRVLLVAGSIGAALLVAVAVLTLAGVRLSLIHLVALQLVAGVGLDYALFFARRQLDTEERARTLRTLVTCNGMTLLTFGLLAACQTPVLRDIGMAVAVGAVLAMGFAFLFAGQRQADPIRMDEWNP